MKMGSKNQSERPVLHLEVNNRTKYQSGLEGRLEDLVSVAERSKTIQVIINNFGVKVLLFLAGDHPPNERLRHSSSRRCR